MGACQFTCITNPKVKDPTLCEDCKLEEDSSIEGCVFCHSMFCDGTDDEPCIQELEYNSDMLTKAIFMYLYCGECSEHARYHCKSSNADDCVKIELL